MQGIAKISALCFAGLSLNIPAQAQGFAGWNNPEPFQEFVSRYASWTDYNMDGGQDLFECNLYNSTNKAWLLDSQELKKGLRAQILEDGGSSYVNSWADVDGDGDLDALVGGIFESGLALYIRNNATGELERSLSGIWENFKSNTFAAIFADLDGDGDPDIVAGNTELWDPMKRLNRKLIVLRNDGYGNFTHAEIPEMDIRNKDVRSILCEDFTGDGIPDLFLGIFGESSLLLKGLGNGLYAAAVPVESFRPLEETTWAHAGDLDNDGDLDLILLQHGSGPRILINDGQGDFDISVMNNLTALCGAYKGSFTLTDLNADGQLDLFATHLDKAGTGSFLNLAQSGNWLLLRLSGDRSNDLGIGAQVRVKANGKWMVRHQRTTPGSSFVHLLRIHVGLGTATQVDSLIIHWPSGQKDVYTGVNANQYLLCREGAEIVPLDLWAAQNKILGKIQDLKIRSASSLNEERTFFTLSLMYENAGLMAQETHIELKMSKKLTLIRSFPPVSKEDASGYTWNQGRLNPGEDGIITMIFEYPGNLPDVWADAIIYPFTFDENRSDNITKIGGTPGL